MPVYQIYILCCCIFAEERHDAISVVTPLNIYWTSTRHPLTLGMSVKGWCSDSLFARVAKCGHVVIRALFVWICYIGFELQSSPNSILNHVDRLCLRHHFDHNLAFTDSSSARLRCGRNLLAWSSIATKTSQKPLVHPVCHKARSLTVFEMCIPISLCFTTTLRSPSRP
jgi:hypothetical protein